MKRLYFIVFLFASCLAGQANGESIFVVKAKDVFTNTAQLQLIAALAETNFSRADDILKSLPVDTRATNGGTVLWWEANLGNFDAFAYLLRKGAKPGLAVTDTYNTLELCAKQEDPRLLAAAVEHGGNANLIGDFTGQTPIYSAILARRTANVQLLIKNNACLNVSEPTGITPLIWASDAKAFDLVVLLLKHGANPSARDNSGFSALDILQKLHPKADHPMYESYVEAMKLLQGGQ
jgi:ankyrin repeat protein